MHVGPEWPDTMLSSPFDSSSDMQHCTVLTLDSSSGRVRKSRDCRYGLRVANVPLDKIRLETGLAIDKQIYLSLKGGTM